MDSGDIKLLARHALQLLRPQGPNQPCGNDWYYFLHIPKNAGTSFRYALFDEFSARDIYPNNVDYYIRQMGKYLNWHQFNARKTVLFPPSKQMLVGHFLLGPLSSSFRNTPPRIICFLRDPVDRVVSSIVYHSQPGRRYHGLSFQDILSEHGEYEGSLQARYLGYRKQLDNLQFAVQTLGRIDVIGLTEDYKRSIDLVNRTFGWRITAGNLERNKAPSDRPVSQDHRESIAQYCQIDRQIYTEACSIFERRCEEAGI